MQKGASPEAPFCMVAATVTNDFRAVPNDFRGVTNDFRAVTKHFRGVTNGSQTITKHFRDVPNGFWAAPGL
ncbi:hypothetical protein [Hymenobacter psychrotolerans]|nr:hypothetical protein [Hymenobacter psychrotolerans]